MNIVIDTSVLVAAARSRTGASRAPLSRLPDPFFHPVISVPVFAEYQAVLLRPENLLHLQEIYFLWRPTLSDPDDELLFELAVAANASYIVTHNLRDFRGIEKWGIRTASPSAFLKLVETKV